MAGHCKDCKFWEHHVDDCNRQWTTCEAPDFVSIHRQIGDNEAAIFAEALDDWGLRCGLKTGPLFGCMKFNQRKNK